MISERILLSYMDSIAIQCVRPATVCGYSPSMRLDVAVNALTFSALKKNKIKVFGGKQIRPNLNMDDMIDAYIFFIKRKFKKDRKTKDTIFNIGFENLSILNIAKRINRCLLEKYKIDIFKSNDLRSYRQDSSRILSIGFKPKKKIEDAIMDIKKKYFQNNIKNYKKFYRINTLKIIKTN
jgi:nucleoside-diphosphate-sugar epimerase